MKSQDDDSRLLEQLGRLPREMQPRNDPWPQISQRMAELPARPQQEVMQASTRPWGRYLGAVAASLALAFVAGWIVGQRGVQTAAPELVQQASWSELLTASEAEYQAALGEFTPVGDARDSLPYQAVFEIEKGWAILKATEQSLREALQAHPDDPFLVNQLMDLRARQLDFLRQLAELDQIERRSSI